MEQATQLHCSLTELPGRLSAWEKPYWQAWWQIKPSGWNAANLNTARIECAMAQFMGGNKNVKTVDFMLPALTPGAFDPELRKQEDLEAEIRQMESILRDDCGNRKRN